MPESRLDSWKEIAAHLGRSVRTVQRWERQEGLPVHRLQHEKLGSVYAFASELDAWWEERRVGLETAGSEAPVEAEAEVACGSRRCPRPRTPVRPPSRPRSSSPWGRGLVRLGPSAPGAPLLAPRHPALRQPHREPEREYITDGLTEELIADLGRVKDLGVIARTSVMKFKATTKTVAEIARELGWTTCSRAACARPGSACA